MAVSSDGLIDRLDEGLKEYYTSSGRNDYVNNDGIGKFKAYAEDNGFENDDIAEELREQDAKECLCTEFDEDGFPFSTSPENEQEKTQEIFAALKSIAINGEYVVPTMGKGAIKVDLQSCIDIKDDEIEKASDKYKEQMTGIRKQVGKNRDLEYFLAVSEKCNYPFMTYMVDTYTKAHARYYHKQNNTLTVEGWARDNPYMKALKKKSPNVENKLESAIRTYGIRIMPTLKFMPTIKIKDNLKDIVQYIVSIPEFINHLMDQKLAKAPFQVDFLIVPKDVESVVANDNDDEDDDDDDNDDTSVDKKENKDPKEDHIGKNVEQYLQRFPVAHVVRNVENMEQKIARVLGGGWDDFRTRLSKFDGEQKDDGDKIQFEPKTFPQYKRLAILLDRREHKDDTKQNDEKKDEFEENLIFYLYPNNCNTLIKGRVPEYGFELLQRCLIPKGNKTDDNSITAKTDVCGQLLTFMFSVEAKDEIKCYIVWNQQSMRFHADHIEEVLPCLFADNKENHEFIVDKNEVKKMKEAFENQTMDVRYTKFCENASKFQNQK